MLKKQDFAPLVSICIPTHNRKETLETILEMIRTQTFQDFEVIVCDDGSSDGTFEYLASLGWPNLTILRNTPNLGYPGTMARLFGQARGMYIAVQHDHDPIEPQWLERMVALMEGHPTAGLGCCANRFWDGSGAVVEFPTSGLPELFPTSGLLHGRRLVEVLATRPHTPLAVTASLFRREVVERAGGYRPDWFLASDEDLYRRVAAISDVAYCPERLFTLTARPSESNKALGGWRSIYTLYAFRRDTALHYCRSWWLGRYWKVLCLSILRWFALLSEGLSLWLRGDTDWLAEALRPDIIPHLPDDRPPLGRLEYILMSAWVGFLKRGSRFGKALGAWRSGRNRGREARR
jgi:glycosyltransferase involved in cell wall biosynthesis